MQELEEFIFWENRVVHTTEELAANPDLLWRSASNYFTDSMRNPLTGFGYNERTMRRVQPFTLIGLCMYLDCGHAWFETLKDTFFYKKKADLTETDKKLAKVLDRIENTIHQQQYIYAAAGLLNTRFIALDMGMYEKGRNDRPTKIRVKIGDD